LHYREKVEEKRNQSEKKNRRGEKWKKNLEIASLLHLSASQQGEKEACARKDQCREQARKTLIRKEGKGRGGKTAFLWGVEEGKTRKHSRETGQDQSGAPARCLWEIKKIMTHRSSAEGEGEKQRNSTEKDEKKGSCPKGRRKELEGGKRERQSASAPGGEVLRGRARKRGVFHECGRFPNWG